MIPTCVQGRAQYIRETRAIYGACELWSSAARHRKRSATLSSWRVETACRCCTRSLGEAPYRSQSMLRAPHAHRAMGLLDVKPEGGGERARARRRTRGRECRAILALQGRAISAWRLSRKRKSAMAGMDEGAGISSTQGLPTAAATHQRGCDMAASYTTGRPGH